MELPLTAGNVGPVTCISLAGERVDGHDFVDNAVKNGATAVLVARPVEADVYQALVNDPIDAIGALQPAGGVSLIYL